VILVVGDDFPWPSTYGGALRSARLIEAIARLGEIDLFTLTYPLRSDPCLPPAHLPVRRLKTVTGPAPDYSASRRLKWLVSRREPLELVAATPVNVTGEFRAWAEKHYDLCFFSRVATFHQVDAPRLGPTLVDFVDLEDQKILARLQAERHAAGHAGGAMVRVHRVAASVQGNLNASRWRRLQVQVANTVDRVLVASELDRVRFGLPNVSVVANGYDAPDRPLGRAEVSDSPTILLQGSLLYGPNADAARRLANVILPRIHAHLPNVHLRLVGEADAGVTKLHAPPAVFVVGKVPSMEPELAMADLIAVPLPYGSGTRVKILEAMAHRIPVVSTTIGAEGLDIENGRHALIVDDMEGFAMACVALLTQPDLRGKLVDAAHERFLERHQWSSAQAAVESLAGETATSPPPTG
jgi:glycosyltransferase involved in cell wall biosynthesis